MTDKGAVAALHVFLQKDAAIDVAALIERVIVRRRILAAPMILGVDARGPVAYVPRAFVRP
jgi:hypothetical protein